MRVLPQDDRLALLRDIAARARPTGGPAIAAARESCARELRELGFDVRERPFSFSAFPGKFATPLLGGAAALTVGVAGEWGASGARVAPFVLLAASAALLFGAGRWLARRGVLEAPVLRQRGVNLEAAHAGTVPRVWLCAHLDSKSQPVPTLLRSAGVVMAGLGYLLTLGLATAAIAGWHLHRSYWTIAALVTLVGAIPVVLSIVTWRSPGALDNASGVATIMAAARQVGRETAVGVLITDAEELGLAGARAWAAERGGGGGGPGDEALLNCDGVDDSGAIVAMYSAAPPARLLRALARATVGTGIAHERTRMIPGVLTDSVAFADRGLMSVTFSRGTWRSLARVHTRRDDLAHLRGTGIAETATLIAATVREMTGEERR